MRISDWSSDVCSSDLLDLHPRAFGGGPHNGQGHCAQSHLSHAAITLHQVSDDAGQGPAFHLYVRRSFSDYLWRWLAAAAPAYEAMAAKARPGPAAGTADRID